MDTKEKLDRLMRLSKELHRLKTKYSGPSKAKYADDIKEIEKAIEERMDKIRAGLDEEEDCAYFMFVAGDR